MREKILLEFFPELEFQIPSSPGGSCCLKPTVAQSKRSLRMYIQAQHIRSKFRNHVELKIPSKTKSKIILVKKYTNYKAYRRGKKLGVMRLPALALNGRILCQGTVLTERELDDLVGEIMGQEAG
jgi:hypothetical protein